MKPFFPRIGNKYPISKEIINMFPKYTTYVEPFVGSGAILFSKEPSPVEIINDLDGDVFENFQLLKDANTDVNAYQLLNDIQNIQRFVNGTHISKENRLLQKLYLSMNTFSGKNTGKIYQAKSGKQKIKYLGFYKNRIQDVEIKNSDYKEIITHYDSAETLFFLDPPYEQTNLYNHSTFDYIELQAILKNIKGKFILTLNDSLNIRTIFKDYQMTEIKIKGNYTPKSVGSKDRTELIITNY